MLTVIESQDALDVVSTLPTGQRILFGLLALFPLLAPYELILRPGWESYFNLFFLFALVISLGAMAISLFLAFAAVAGLNSRMRFDRGQGLFSFASGAPVVPWRTVQSPLVDLAGVQVQKTDWSEGSPSYSLLVVLKDGREFKSGSAWSQAEIEEIRQRVASFLSSIPIS